MNNAKPEITDETILVFDKDGVLFHSEDFKFEYFLTLFDEYPTYIQDVQAYLVSSGGTPRKLRFEHICKNIIGLTEYEVWVEDLAEKSGQEINSAISNMGFVEGAEEYLNIHLKNEKYVCSGASMDEVEKHLEINGISGLFQEVYGGVTKKSKVLKDLKKRLGDNMVFYGDTMVDYNASVEAGVKFVGLRTSKYHDPFKEMDICKVHNFLELI
ncbi:MAG: HAD family hydrolase [Cyclobacteriaceae bacterium]